MNRYNIAKKHKPVNLWTGTILRRNIPVRYNSVNGYNIAKKHINLWTCTVQFRKSTNQGCKNHFQSNLDNFGKFFGCKMFNCICNLYDKGPKSTTSQKYRGFLRQLFLYALLYKLQGRVRGDRFVIVGNSVSILSWCNYNLFLDTLLLRVFKYFRPFHFTQNIEDSLCVVYSNYFLFFEQFLFQ